MTEIVIPSLKKLCVVIPDAVFELYQQMKKNDCLSFQAVGNKDEPYNFSLKRQEGATTAINIESIGDESVVEFSDDEWKCQVNSITSAAFLVQATNEIVQNNEELITAPTSDEALNGKPQDVTHIKQERITTDSDIDEVIPSSESVTEGFDTTVEMDIERSTVVSEVQNIESVTHIDTSDQSVLQQQLTQVNSTSPTLVSLVNPIIFKPDTIDGQAAAPDELVLRDMADMSGTLGDEVEDSDQPLHEAQFKVEEVGEEEVDNTQQDSMVTHILFGKKKKVTLMNSHGIQVIRDAQEKFHHKCVQSEPHELAGYDTRDADTAGVGTDSEGLDLDSCLSETASASQTAEVILNNILEKKNNQMTDPQSSVQKFPIIMEGGKYKCHICSMLLLRRNYLVNHMRFVHKICVRDPLALTKCPHCDEMFSQKNRLTEHILHKHNDEKPFECDMEGCDMRFKTVYNLRDHKRIFHYHMLRYACDICERQYENPNTVVRHRKACYKERGGSVLDFVHKDADELRNPRWIPVNDLFNTIPQHRPRHRSNLLNRNAVHNSQTSQKHLPADAPDNCSDTSVNKQPRKPHLLNSTSHHLTTRTDVDKENQLLGKRKTSGSEESVTDYSPVKKVKVNNSEVPVEHNVPESGRKSRRLAGQEKRDYKKMAMVGEDEGVDKVVSNLVKTEQTQELAKEATPLRDINRDRKKHLNFDQDEDVAYIESEYDEVTKDVKHLTFQVDSILCSDKTYTIDHSELCRRLYGPETMNPVTFMSFISKREGCNKIAEFKKLLLSHGYKVPKFTKVTSCFSKLCEGEIKDILNGFYNLKTEYLSEKKIVCGIMGEIVKRCNNKHGDIYDVLHQHIKSTCTFVRLVSIHFSEHVTEFSQVTHGFGSCVLQHLFKFFCSVLKILDESFSEDKFEDESEDDYNRKTNRLKGTSGNESTMFTVPGMLGVSATIYEVSEKEIARRIESPEEMTLTLLHKYLRKGVSSDEMVLEECTKRGLIVLKENTSCIQSCFSKLVEGEAKQLCSDLKDLLCDHYNSEKLCHTLMRNSNSDINKIFSSISMMQPYVEEAVKTRCEYLDLVTHTVGKELLIIAWKFITDMALECRNMKK